MKITVTIALLLTTLLLRAQSPAILGDTIICQGNTLSLETQFLLDAAYTWTDETGAILSTVHTLNLPDFNFDQAGFYALEVNHPSYPDPTTETEILVVPPPAAPEISHNGPVCAGNTLQLFGEALPDATYRWLDPFGGVLATTQNAEVENIIVEQAGIYTLEVTQYGCTSPQNFADIGVISEENAPVLTADTVVCPGAALQISAPVFADADYFWEAANGFTSTESGQIIIENTSADDAGIYTLVITANGCETPAGSIEIAVQNEVSGMWTEDISVCEGQPGEAAFQLTGSAPFEIFFSDGENGSIAEAAESNAGSVTIFPTGSTEYILRQVIDANDCVWEGEEILPVTVHENPAFSNFQDELCNGTNSAYVVQFSVENGTEPYTAAGLEGILNGTQFISANIPTGTGYEVQVTDANGCQTDVFTGLNNCNCETSAGAIDLTPLRFCTNETAVVSQEIAPTLDADDVFYYVLHDNSDFFASEIIAESPAPFFDFTSNLNVGQTYYLTAVAGTNDGSGKVDFSDLCADLSGTVSVLFSEQAPTPIISGAPVLCPGEFLEITTESHTANGNISYRWTTPNSVFTTVNPTLFIESVGAENAGDYRVQIDVNGCLSETSPTFDIAIISPEDAAVTQADTTLCGSGSGNIRANLPPQTTGIWTSNRAVNFLNSNQNQTAVFNLPEGETTLFWTLSTDACPAYSTDSLTVKTVYAAAAADDRFTLPEDALFLEINPTENDPEAIDGTRTISFTDLPENLRIEKLNEDIYEVKRPLCFMGEMRFNYAACTVTEVCPLLCDTAEIVLNVESAPGRAYLHIPDGITANDDGLNDFWVMEGIEKYPNNDLTIVSQSGQVVYRARPYTNDWQGQFQGKKLPEGAYYFVLQTDVSSKETVKGRVYLFR